MTAADYAQLALSQLRFAGLLALLFAVVTLAYLGAALQVAGKLDRASAFLLHTLFLGWQSNVAYLAVVTLLGARRAMQQVPGMLEDIGWGLAPALVPGAAVLYGSMLLLSLLFYRAQARRSHS